MEPTQQLSPDKVRETIQMFLKVANGIVVFLPDNAKALVQKLVTVLTALAGQDWVVDLVVFLYNTFVKEPVVTQEKVTEALEHFRSKVDKGEEAPKVYTFSGPK